MGTLFKTLFFLLLTLQSLNATLIEFTQKEKEFLKSHPIITLGSDHNWIPYIIKNEDGTTSGYDADILKEVNRLTGANFTLVTGTWKNIVVDATNRNIDGLSTSAVQKSEKNILIFPMFMSQHNDFLLCQN